MKGFGLKTIEKAILRELLITFLLALVSFNFMLMMEKLLKLTRLISSVGASMFDMASIVLLLQPGLLILTTPLSFLIAVLLTYGRLSMDNELTALKASGMSFTAISRPVRLFGIACFLMSLLFSFYIAPKGSKLLTEVISGIISERTRFAIEEGTFNTSFPGIVMHVSEKPSYDTLKEVFIYDERDSKQPKTLFAREGRILSGDPDVLSFSLKDGFVHIARGSFSTELFFERYSFKIPISFSRGTERKKIELTPIELLVKAEGSGKKERVILRLEFHRRLSFPALCLVLIFLAPPLSLIAGNAGRFGGFIIGLSVFAVYYTGLIYGERLAIAGSLPHFIGAWAPIIISGIGSFLVFKKAGSK